MALCATVRSIPTLAAVGWTLISYTIFAVLFFAGPIALISGELSTMLPQEGGPQLWVKTALGSKWVLLSLVTMGANVPRNGNGCFYIRPFAR